MIRSTVRRFRSLLTLGLVFASGVLAQTSFTHPDCRPGADPDGASPKCVTIRAHHYFEGGGGVASIDRVNARIDAPSCTYTTVNGFKTTISGNIDYALDGGNLPLDRTWTFPAACPLSTHARMQNDSWRKDDIFLKKFGVSESDHCFSYDWWNLKTTSEGCN